MDSLLADLLMFLHFLWLAFMILGLPMGLYLRRPALRWAHFAGMMLTASFAAAGLYCPLTLWEEALRAGGDAGFSYGGSFAARHLSPILYPEMHPGLIRGASILWGGLTVLAIVVIRPGKREGNDGAAGRHDDGET